MRGTRLAELYEKNLYAPPTLEEFALACAECVGNISANMVIHRLTGDCPRNMLVAPEWNKNKSAIIDSIVKKMKELSITQGSLLSVE